MNIQFTPGPWEYSSGQVWADGSAKCVARRSDDSGISPRQRDADMRLCAAAPELLAALRLCVNRIGGWAELDEVALAAADAAIAKAEGRD